jgi:hypothetical protein
MSDILPAGAAVAANGLIAAPANQPVPDPFAATCAA